MTIMARSKAATGRPGAGAGSSHLFLSHEAERQITGTAIKTLKPTPSDTLLPVRTHLLLLLKEFHQLGDKH